LNRNEEFRRIESGVFTPPPTSGSFENSLVSNPSQEETSFSNYRSTVTAYYNLLWNINIQEGMRFEYATLIQSDYDRAFFLIAGYTHRF
jgi:hypothetical protein